MRRLLTLEKLITLHSNVNFPENVLLYIKYLRDNTQIYQKFIQNETLLILHNTFSLQKVKSLY